MKKTKFKRTVSAMTACAITAVSSTVSTLANTIPTASAVTTNAVLEYLDRGISAINTGNGMMVSWRFLANDPDNAVYKLYRDNTLIYTSDAGMATSYLDKGGSATSNYKVETYSGDKLLSSDTCRLISGQSYFDIPMDVPKGGSDYTYSPNDCSFGDVDGDGQYEIFVKWDPSNSKDNSQDGVTGNVYIDCYTLTGTKLWRIDLGKNIRAGAHYTQFIVADFDLDGKAEMTCKTADGTVDGVGKVIGDASKDYRNSAGRVLDGPEFYTLFDGATGAALDTVDYEYPRGDATSANAKKTWGDNYGNRCDRFLGAAVYLDGVHPSAVSIRGYYTRMTAVAYDVVDKKLVKRWGYDSGWSRTGVSGYGNGNHNCMPADVDGDGKQELFLGSCCIDDNGKMLWANNRGHGDAMHLGDLIPDRHGLEAWVCHEESEEGGVSLLDAATGEAIFHKHSGKDTGRCAADNIYAGNPGAEFWGAESGNVYDSKGDTTGIARPAQNFFIYWDGDLEREMLDNITISKINNNKKIDNIFTASGCASNNSTKATPNLTADLFGDWREELILRTEDNTKLRVFCTPYETDYRITTLVHDSHYRMQCSAEQTSYNQPPHVSYFLGTGYDLPARPTDTVNTNGVSSPLKAGAVIDTSFSYRLKNKKSGLYLEVADSLAENGANVQQGTDNASVWTFVDGGSGYYYIYSEVGDGKTYLLDIDYGKVDNGTNIGIFSNTNSDAQLFKLVDNGDGSYTICTKVTRDESALGITAASTEVGANVVEWECNDSDDQKWVLEMVYPELNGEIIKNLKLKDKTYYSFWKIAQNAQVGTTIFGDRDFTYTALPGILAGAETIQTSCDSKYTDAELAEFTVSKDAKVYVAIDTRVEESMGTIPEWLKVWTKTGEQAESSNDVKFDIYELTVKAGETVYLGTNSTSYTVVNYTVFAKADEAELPTEPPTTAPTEQPTQTPTEKPTDAPSGTKLLGDANCDGVVTIADATAILQHLGNKDKYALSAQGLINADVAEPAGITANDALAIQQFDAGLISGFEE